MTAAYEDDPWVDRWASADPIPSKVEPQTIRPRTRWTAVDLMSATFPEPKWAVKGLLAEGLNLLVGPPKLGKSWLALNIATAIAHGGRALGRVRVDRGEVLYLALEDPPRRLKRRLEMVLQGDRTPEGLFIATEWRTMPEGGADDLAEFLTQHPACRLVVVDVFAKIRGRVGESNLYDQDYMAMSRLKRIADDFSVCVMVVHHTRKSASDDFVTTVSGTNGLAGAADAILVLARTRATTDAVMHITGRDVEEAQYALRFEPSAGAWTMLDGPVSDHATTPERRAVLELLRRKEGLGPKAISEELGISHDNAKQLVRRMVEKEEIETDGHGRYFAPAVPVSPVSPLSPTEEGSDRGDTGDTPLEGWPA
jgi:DNA-binding NarL/FixJ family response regulator